MRQEFEEIGAYEQEDFAAVRDSLISDKQFCTLLRTIGSMMDSNPDLVNLIANCRNVDDLDWHIIIPMLDYLLSKTSKGVQLKGSENIGSHNMYLSNHRDIILDATLLTKQLREFDNRRLYMGMGTNLYVLPWIEPLVRLAKCYSVIRGGSPREVLANSTRLSEYIYQIVALDGQSSWLAQREGRAKDSNDLTQPALIKMLLLATKGNNIYEQLAPLNITPVAISYEYDPCDYLKAQELQLRRDNPDFRKTANDDFVSMKQGLLGYKGQIRYNICKPLNCELQQINNSNTIRNAQVNAICEFIDKQIHLNYSIYNVNMIAFDMLQGTRDYADIYTTEQYQQFEKYIDGQLSKIQIADKDTEFLRNKMLEMYSNPLINQLKAQQSK